MLKLDYYMILLLTNEDIGVEARRLHDSTILINEDIDVAARRLHDSTRLYIYIY